MNAPHPEHYPKLACICCTYARPRLLSQAIESYLRQDYPPDRVELIVLDDAGQYVSQTHSSPKRWQIVSTTQRFRTLGEKRNASAAMVSDDVEAYVVWDDDDIYLPWTLKAHAAALTQAPWSLPSRVLVEKPEDYRLALKETGGLFHSAWAFSRELFANVGGYPFIQSGQDQALAKRFHALNRNPPLAADPIALGFDPFLVYRWATTESWHISALDRRRGYQRLARQRHQGPPVEQIEPYWPRDYTQARPDETTSPAPEANQHHQLA